jgi:very-short-patch-repair endonuclease
MDPHSRTVEDVVRRLADRQTGNVTRAQLLAAGLSATQIRDRVRVGYLIPRYRGVYSVGHRAQSVEGRYLAAVLACGEGSLLCGLAAASLLALIKQTPRIPEVLTRTERRVPGIKTRRSRNIDRRDATAYRGVPGTTVPRTLVDIAALLPPDDLARACHQAEVLHRTTPAHVEAVLARRPNTPGAAKLRRVLRGEYRVVLSKLEARFLALLRVEGLSLRQTNGPASGHRVDCRWPEQRLTVELDGYRYHQSRHAWEQDRRREREARARGDEFRRYTYGDVVEQPRLMLRELRGLLPRRRPA